MLKEGELIGALHPVPTRGSPIYRQADRVGCKTLPPKPSSPSRMRGCLTNCASAPRTSLTYRRPYRVVGSADGHFRGAPGHQKLTRGSRTRYSTPCWRMRYGFARRRTGTYGSMGRQTTAPVAVHSDAGSLCRVAAQVFTVIRVPRSWKSVVWIVEGRRSST